MARPSLPKVEQLELKDLFVEYFKVVPVQKYAAMYVGVSEQTIINWMKDDKDFFNRVNQARSLWVKGKLIKSKAEFALERLEKEVFKESTEQTIIMPTPIMTLNDDNTSK